MALTDQEIEDRRKRIETRAGGRGFSMDQLGPLAPVARAALTALDYTRHGVTEDIQRLGEMRETYDERGLGGLASHLGREIGSDVLDFTSDISKGLIPEGWGERLDPSDETQMGLLLEQTKEDWRRTEGREPSLEEQYMMKADIQDAAMPGLTERRKLGPWEFSNRALIEVGADIPTIAAEVALTGGSAAVGRKALQAATRASVKIAQSQAGRGAKREVAGRAAGKAVSVAGHSVNQIFHMPRYTDIAVGATVGRALGLSVYLPWKATTGTWKTGRMLIDPSLYPTTEGGLKVAVNYFRRDALNRGALGSDVNRRATNVVEKAAREGKLNENTQLHFGQRGADLWRNEALDSAGADGTPWWRRRFWGTHPKGSDPTPPTGNAIYDSFRPVDASPEGQRLLNKDLSNMEMIHDSVVQIRHNLTEFLRGMKEARFGVKARVDPEAVEKASRSSRFGRRVGETITTVQDQWLNRQEALIAKARSQTYFYIGALEKAGMLRWNVGGYTGRAAEQFDEQAELTLASGNSFTGLVRGSATDAQNRGNHSVVLPDIPSAVVPPDVIEATTVGSRHFAVQNRLFEEGIGESGYTLRGHTRINVESMTGLPTYYLDNTGKAAGPIHQVDRYDAAGNILTTRDPNTNVVFNQTEWVADNLDPSIGDIIEHLGLYRSPLRSVRNVVQRIDGQGNPIEGDWMNAYDVFEEMANIARELETALSAAGSGVTHAFTGRSISSGGTYYPRNAMGGGKVTDSHFPMEDPQPELAFKIDETGQFLPTTHSKRRQFTSQAEGQWAGQWYIDPSMAMDDYATYVARHIMAVKSGQFVSRVADAYDIPNGTVDDLLKDSDGYQHLLKQGQELEDALAYAVKRQRDINPKGTGQKINKAEKLFQSMNYWLRLRPIYGNNDVGMNKTIFEHLDTLQQQANEWVKTVKAAKGEWAIATRDVLRISNAMTAYKKAVDDAKEAVLKDYKSISGVAEATGTGLEGLYFPKVLAQSILSSNLVREKASDAIFLARVNSYMRMVGATGDFSAFGIQGWTGVLGDTLDRAGVINLRTGANEIKIDRRGDAFTALRASWDAFGNNGDQVVGEYFWRQEQMALQMGTLTPTDAANAGLAILKNAPDLNYTSAAGLRSLPGIKKFDRVFTHYGNVFRYERFDTDMAIEMMRTGKTAQQLIQDGTATEIATVANFMSGVGRRGFLGTPGQMLLFAPRFLHARMKMLSLAAQGLMPGVTKTTQQRVAAQHLSRAFGNATYLTFMINELLGEETDINPFVRNQATKQWYFNPNFLRVHAGPIDVSLLGPWDGMLRLTTLPLLILANVGQEGWSSLSALRSAVSAPGTGYGLDMAFGSDVIGRSTAPPKDSSLGEQAAWFLDQFAEHLTPFAWSEFAFSQPGQQSIVSRVFGGFNELTSDPLKGIGTIAAGVGQTAGQLMGVKSAYETINEAKNEAYNDILEKLTYEQKLQVFGVDTGAMTEEEMEQLWAQAGEAWWKRAVDIGEDWSVSISFRGRLGDQVPKWEDIANDHKKKIKEMISSGAFKDVMTPEEMADFESRINERRARSASAYDQYKLEREAIDRRQLDAVRAIEDAYNNPDPGWRKGLITVTYINEDGEQVTEDVNLWPGDLKAYSKYMRTVNGNFAKARRILTAPGGTYYKVVEDLFGEGELSRNVSEWDVDIYDAAQYFYFDTFYEETKDKEGKILPSIVSGLDGTIDWNLKDKKTEHWYKMMEERYPSIARERLTRYLWRVEDSMVKDSPPLTETLFEMQKYISRQPLVDGNTYYEFDNIGIDLLTKASGLDRETVENFYIQWKAAGSDAKKNIATEARSAGIINLEDIDRLRQTYMDSYFNMRDAAAQNLRGTEYQTEREGRALIESMLAILDKRYSTNKKPYSRRAQEAFSILERHRRGDKLIPNMTEFVIAVSEGTTLEPWRKTSEERTLPRTKVTAGAILAP